MQKISQIGYVVGFMFNTVEDQVALIQKIRPDWQAGKLNGIGGKIEPGEFPYAAMVREFQEETGVADTEWDWFCDIEGDDFVVHFFRTNGDIYKLGSPTVEQVKIVRVEDLASLNVVPNLRWLIPFALNKGGATAIVTDY